jgi:exopolysaccharide biosynthesis polyprenyl glycosylphosphotransferase
MSVLDQRPGAGFGGAGLSTATLTDRSRELTVVRSKSRWQKGYVHRCIAVDFCAALVGGSSAYLARWGGDTKAPYLVITALLPLVWVGAVALSRAYEPRFLGAGSEEFRRIGRATVGLIALVSFVAYAFNLDPARRFVLVGIPVTAAITLAARYALRRWLHHRRAMGEYLHRVLVVGHEGPVIDMLHRLGDESWHGLQVVGACLPVSGHRPALLDRGVGVIGGFDSVARAVRVTDADTVAVLASPDFGPEELRQLAWDLEPTGADLMVAPSLVEVAGPRLSIRPVSGLPLLQVEQPQFTGIRRIVKATFDRAMASLALIILLPLLLLIGVFVRVTSTGPALFRQERVGRNGRTFTMVKFRTMVLDAEDRRDALLDLSDRDGLMFKMRMDPRITRVGALLRRYSLDELPQLINVVRGDMSLVGPRPPLPAEVAEYAADVRRRLLVHPGLTGLWQVSGRADLSWEESVRLDLRYVDNWSLATDLLILWKTARAVLTGSGAY